MLASSTSFLKRNLIRNSSSLNQPIGLCHTLNIQYVCRLYQSSEIYCKNTSVSLTEEIFKYKFVLGMFISAIFVLKIASLTADRGLTGQNRPIRFSGSNLSLTGVKRRIFTHKTHLTGSSSLNLVQTFNWPS